MSGHIGGWSMDFSSGVDVSMTGDVKGHRVLLDYTTMR
jgi:hypothetical protein